MREVVGHLGFWIGVLALVLTVGRLILSWVKPWYDISAKEFFTGAGIGIFCGAMGLWNLGVF